MSNACRSFFQTLRRPVLFEQSPHPFWDDEHISVGMLAAHLEADADGASRRHEFIARSARWIASLTAPAAGKRLLDLGCGPGLYAEHFQQCGFAVFGMDLSRRSIEYARMHTDPAISYHCGDYIRAEFPEAVDVATMIYCDFGVLPPESRRTLLNKVFRVLKPGGRFVFDVFTPRQYGHFRETSSITENMSGGFWSPEPHMLLDRHLAYREDHTFLRQATVLTENELKSYHIWEHVFTRRELRTALTATGFREINFYGDVGGAPDDPKSKTLAVVAEK